MDEYEATAMIATILEFLNSREKQPFLNYIAVRYRDNLRIARQQIQAGI